MAILEDIWDGICNFADYVWCNGDLLAFVILAAIGITAAVYVVTDRIPVHSAFYLALVFFTVGVAYFFLEAEFITCCEPEKLDGLERGKSFQIQGGSVLSQRLV